VVRRKAAMSASADATASPSIWTQASRLDAQEMRWLLPQRIILGSLCVLEGDTSVGKSTFLSALAASVTTGREWLGRPEQPPRAVLWVSGEEDFATQINPRLVAAGADLGRVHVPQTDDHGERIRISLPESIPALRDVCWEREIDLIILEPLSSMVGPSTDLNQVVATRLCLDPLQRMCFAAGVTCIVTRGLRKDRSGPRSAHGQGSSAIGDTARSVLVIDAPDPSKSDRVMRVVKCSRSCRVPAVSYTIEPGVFGPTMEHLQEMTRGEEIDADTVADPAERSVREDARSLLRKMLGKGWVRSNTIRLAAEDAMVSQATLRRAAADLGIVTRQTWDGQSSYHEWSAPDGGWESKKTIEQVNEHLGMMPKKQRKSRKKTQ
jgi:putative DNA primase/helicase